MLHMHEACHLLFVALVDHPPTQCLVLVYVAHLGLIFVMLWLKTKAKTHTAPPHRAIKPWVFPITSRLSQSESPNIRKKNVQLSERREFAPSSCRGFVAQWFEYAAVRRFLQFFGWFFIRCCVVIFQVFFLLYSSACCTPVYCLAPGALPALVCVLFWGATGWSTCDDALHSPSNFPFFSWENFL